MNVKQRREPIFVDGIYALVVLAVIAGPLWILAKCLWRKRGQGQNIPIDVPNGRLEKRT